MGQKTNDIGKIITGSILDGNMLEAHGMAQAHKHAEADRIM